jgi:hypothetical protein
LVCCLIHRLIEHELWVLSCLQVPMMLLLVVLLVLLVLLLHLLHLLVLLALLVLLLHLLLVLHRRLLVQRCLHDELLVVHFVISKMLHVVSEYLVQLLLQIHELLF